MNIAATPEVVAAEIAYRYERDHVGPSPHPDRPGLLQRLVLRRWSLGHRSTAVRRA